MYLVYLDSLEVLDKVQEDYSLSEILYPAFPEEPYTRSSESEQHLVHELPQI